MSYFEIFSSEKGIKRKAKPKTLGCLTVEPNTGPVAVTHQTVINWANWSCARPTIPVMPKKTCEDNQTSQSRREVKQSMKKICRKKIDFNKGILKLWKDGIISYILSSCPFPVC